MVDSLEKIEHTLRVAALRASVADGWQPMDSAPKGERILMLMKHGAIEGTWDGEVGSGYYWRDMEWDAYNWMPLPAEPSAAAPTREAAPIAQGEQGDAIATITGTYGDGGHIIWPEGGPLPIGTKLYTRQPAPAEPMAASYAQAVLDEYVRICVNEHHDDAPPEARIKAMQRALTAAKAAPDRTDAIGDIADECMRPDGVCNTCFQSLFVTEQAEAAPIAQGEQGLSDEAICAIAKHNEHGHALASMLRDEVLIRDFRAAVIGLVRAILTRQPASPAEPVSMSAVDVATNVVDALTAAKAAQPDCTEPNRADCPRRCMDFCNKAEEAKAAQPESVPQVDSGEEVMPSMDNFRMKCCECGLVHEWKFRVVKARWEEGGEIWIDRDADTSGYRVVMSATRAHLEGDRNE